MVDIDAGISLHKLEAFCLVVEAGGVHAAAGRMYISQPVVSAHLSSLQRKVGVELFVRQGRRLVLTEAGRAVYAWAREVLNGRAALERDLDDVASGRAGTATLAASSTVGGYHLPPVLTAFSLVNPLVRITLSISDPDTVLRWAKTGECDLAVLVTDRSIDPGALVCERVADEDFVLVAGPDAGVPESIEIGELGALPSVCPPVTVAIRRLQDAALRAVGVNGRRVVLELGSAEAIKYAVAHGLGVALLSRAVVAQELAQGRLRNVDVAGVRLSHPIVMVRRIEHRLTPAQVRLMADIRRHWA